MIETDRQREKRETETELSFCNNSSKLDFLS